MSYINTQPLSNLNGRQQRWMEFIQVFSFTIEHQPGKTNLSDALTRRPDYINSKQPTQHSLKAIQNYSSEFEVDLLEQIKNSYDDDPVCKRLFQEKETSKQQGFSFKDGLLYKDQRIYIPDTPIKHTIISEAHTSKTACHGGVNKTIELLSRNYHFPHMHSSVSQFIGQCQQCQTSKSNTQKPAGLLFPHVIPSQPWHTVAMDFITELPPTAAPNIKNAILVVTDKITKMTHLIPINISISAPEVARLFFHHIVRLHGLPKAIISDRDVRFTSRFWKALFTLCGTKLNFSSSHHPQTDGQSERMIRTIEDVLRTQLNGIEQSWLDNLDSVEIAINNSLQSSTLQSPFFLNYGFHPQFTLNISQAHTNNAAATDLVKVIQDNLNRAKLNLEQAITRQKHYADQHRRELMFQLGDLVFLSTKYIQLKNYSCSKLKPRYIGPFKVIKVVSSVTFKLELPISMLIHPVFHVSLLKPHHGHSFVEEQLSNNNSASQPASPLPATDSPPQPVITSNTAPLYEVERVLGKRCRGNRIQYLVKWVGYEDHENS